MTAHLLLVYLRCNPDPAVVSMASLDAARETAAFAAVTWLRKCAPDRAGVWLVTHQSGQIVLGEQGVDVKPHHDVIAAFDPREVVAVQVLSREVEAWKAGAE